MPVQWSSAQFLIGDVQSPSQMPLARISLELERDLYLRSKPPFESGVPSLFTAVLPRPSDSNVTKTLPWNVSFGGSVEPVAS